MHDNFLGGNHLHAAGEAGWRDIGAEAITIVRTTVSEGDRSALPAPASSAAIESPDRVKVLVGRVGFPVRRFASARHDDTCPRSLPARWQWDGGGEVH
jgi:hypothetical protein